MSEQQSEPCEHDLRPNIGTTNEYTCTRCGALISPRPIEASANAFLRRINNRPAPAIPAAPATDTFPDDKPGWFYRPFEHHPLSVRCTSERDNDSVRLESNEWIRIADLRTWVRSASLSGPWKSYIDEQREAAPGSDAKDQVRR